MSVLESISTQQEPVCSLLELMLGTQSQQNVHFVGLHHSIPVWSEDNTMCPLGPIPWFHFLQKKPDWALWEHSAKQLLSMGMRRRFSSRILLIKMKTLLHIVLATSIHAIQTDFDSNRFEQQTARKSWKYQLMLNLSHTGNEGLYSQTSWCSSFSSQPGAYTEHEDFIAMKTCREAPQPFYPVSELSRIRQNRKRQDWLEM